MPVPLRWLVVGVALMQLAWIAALPPFAGVDEFDHVYRASSVAHGEWVSAPENATRGTGATVSVTRAIVEAARPECQRLDYTRPEDCVGVPDGDRVEIASGAGRYNPFFYAVVGYPGSLLDGVGALYAMRLLAAGLCLALLAAALAGLCRWARPRVLAAVAVGLTPTLVYSTAVVAPNGLEMAAGLAFWTSLAGLAHEEDRPGRHLALATVSGALLVLLRSMGPLWALLILVTSLVAWRGLGPVLLALLRTTGGRVAAAVAVTSGVVNVAWVLTQKALVIGRQPAPDSIDPWFRLARSAQEVPLWLLQAIAAFPSRDEPAPLVVYPLYLILLGFLLVVGLRSASTRVRAALLVTVVLAFVIPYGVTVATLGLFGTSWQGRYGMPYLIGAALLAGVAWASRPGGHGVRWSVPVGALVLVAHATGLIAVTLREARLSPLSGTDRWALQLPAVVMVPLVVLGAGLVAAAVMRWLTREVAA